MLHIIYFEPRIPGNTGAAIRLAACTGAQLHLVEPLGFSMDEARLKRAGLDYHDLAHVEIHSNFDSAIRKIPGRIWAFTGSATTTYNQIKYQNGDGLLFGPEPSGLPLEIMNHQAITQLIRVQMRPNLRSLNLSNCTSIVLYEAWRQLGFPGGQ